MGANISNTNQQQINDYLISEIQFYKSGEMDKDTARYKLFMMNASKIITLDNFYRELSFEKIKEYIKDVQVFDQKEVSIIMKKIYQISDNDEEADSLIGQILPNILCPCQKSKNISYISPCCSQPLFNDIVRKDPNLECGSYKPRNIFDFDSNEMIELRQCQERSIVLPKFQHSNDVSILIYENSLQKLANQQIYENEDNEIFPKQPMKPLFWEKNIHAAAEKGSIKSILYNVSLIPILRDLQDENGQTPLHVASKSGKSSVINSMKEIKSNFNIYDNDGNLPIHVAKNNATIESFISNGFSLDVPNKHGQLMIEIQSNPFNSNAITSLLKHGVNILIPNNKGQYWSQFVLYNNYFHSKSDQYIEFHQFLRKILSKLKFQFYTENETIQSIIHKNVVKTKNIEIEELRKSVNNNDDISKIQSMLSIGISPDTKINGMTNLMISSQKGDIELVKLFSNNFCDPNMTNDDGENSFWIAAWNKHFEVATLLHKTYNANPDILSKTGQTLLQYAFDQHKEDIFYYLLDSGASPNIKNSENESFLFTCFKNRNDKIAEMIQDRYNGDINCKGKDGNSLGHLAILENDEERLFYLIERGLKINIKNDLGQSLFMFSIINSPNLSICQRLLNKKANINDQDIYGNTSFYLVCQSKRFDKNKFDFLLKNNCNINIQTNSRDFPISQLILKGRKEEALLLLNKNANVNDPNSKNEPICVALQNHDQFWVEKLIDYGANANNKVYAFVENYIKESFFDFETFKKIKSMNVTIGSPIQAALNLNKQQPAFYIWDKSSHATRILLSKSIDQNRQIPLTVSINTNNKLFYVLLINSDFDMTTPDKDGKTPLMHAILKQDKKWYNPIIEKIPKQSLNARDSKNNSAITYAACLNNKELAETLFLMDVEVEGINIDKFGIIQKYANILRTSREIIQKVEDNLTYYKKCLSDCNFYVNYAPIKRRENRITRMYNGSILHSTDDFWTRSDAQHNIHYCDEYEDEIIDNLNKLNNELIPSINKLIYNVNDCLVKFKKLTRYQLLKSNSINILQEQIVPRTLIQVPKFR